MRRMIAPILILLLCVIAVPTVNAAQSCQIVIPGWSFTQLIALENSEAASGMYCPMNMGSTYTGFMSDICVDTLGKVNTGAHNLCTLALKQNAWFPEIIETNGKAWGFPAWKTMNSSSYNMVFANNTAGQDSVVFRYPGCIGNKIIFAVYDSAVAYSWKVIYHANKPRFMAMPTFQGN